MRCYLHSANQALYMAPEVFQMRLGLKCDVWSLGCIMYLLLTGHSSKQSILSIQHNSLSGKLPFIGRTLTEVQFKVTKGEPSYDIDCHGVSSEAIEVMRSMLIKNPTIRPSARRVREPFCYRWCPLLS